MRVLQVSPDSMSAACAYLASNWGHDGYTIGLESGGYGRRSIFLCRSSDGGEFRIIADRWGNVEDFTPTAEYLEWAAS